MIESCLKRNIVNKFLKKYKPKKWNSIIPSLLEIGILYLHNTYKILFYSEDDLSKIIEKLKFKNTTNPVNHSKILQFRNDCKFDIFDGFFGKRNAHSYYKKAKNINELNVYTSYNFDNKIFGYYNTSGEVTPIKRLINNSDLEESFDSIKFQKLSNLDKNTIDEKDIIKKQKHYNKQKNISINYNSIDISNAIKSNRSCLSNNNNSIIFDNNNGKEYIKVNKVQKIKKLKNRTNIEDINYNNTYSNNISSRWGEKIDKNSRIEKINNLKQKNQLLKDYNQKHITKERSRKNNYINNFFMNKQKNLTCQPSINSFNLSYQNDKDINYFPRINKIKIFNNKVNMKKISTREIREKQFSKPKENMINDENEDHNKNNLISDNIRTINLENIEDINLNSIIRNTTNISKSKKKFNLFPESQKGKIINYNSFNKNIKSKNKTFINDPYFFIKVTNKNRNVLNKF